MNEQNFTPIHNDQYYEKLAKDVATCTITADGAKKNNFNELLSAVTLALKMPTIKRAAKELNREDELDIKTGEDNDLAIEITYPKDPQFIDSINFFTSIETERFIQKLNNILENKIDPNLLIEINELIQKESKFK